MRNVVIHVFIEMKTLYVTIDISWFPAKPGKECYILSTILCNPENSSAAVTIRKSIFGGRAVRRGCIQGTRVSHLTRLFSFSPPGIVLLPLSSNECGKIKSDF